MRVKATVQAIFTDEAGCLLLVRAPRFSESVNSGKDFKESALQDKTSKEG
jgi:hypothetical protein